MARSGFREMYMVPPNVWELVKKNVNDAQQRYIDNLNSGNIPRDSRPPINIQQAYAQDVTPISRECGDTLTREVPRDTTAIPVQAPSVPQTRNDEPHISEPSPKPEPESSPKPEPESNSPNISPGLKAVIATIKANSPQKVDVPTQPSVEYFPRSPIQVTPPRPPIQVTPPRPPIQVTPPRPPIQVTPLKTPIRVNPPRTPDSRIFFTPQGPSPINSPNRSSPKSEPVKTPDNYRSWVANPISINLMEKFTLKKNLQLQRKIMKFLSIYQILMMVMIMMVVLLMMVLLLIIMNLDL